MRKNVSIIVIILAILGGVFFLWSRADQEELFLEEGNLIRNNAGFPADTWFLTYEAPGKPGLTKELNITESSQCIDETGKYTCEEYALQSGMRVEIKGEEANDIVQVKEMGILSEEL